MDVLEAGLDTLPPEIWAAVCKHLNVVDIVVLSEVNSATYAIAHSVTASPRNALIGTIGSTSIHYPAYRLKRAMSAWANLKWRYIVAPPTMCDEGMSKFWRQFKKLPSRDRVVKVELWGSLITVADEVATDWSALSDVKSLSLFDPVRPTGSGGAAVRGGGAAVRGGGHGGGGIPLKMVPLLEELTVDAGLTAKPEESCFATSALRQHKSLKTIRLHSTAISNMFPYKAITELHLRASKLNPGRGMPLLRDLSPLMSGDVLRVCTIEGAPNLSDISALSRCINVKLNYLPSLEFVSTLCNVENLEITNCAKVGADIALLGSVKHLVLGHLPNVTAIHTDGVTPQQSLTMHGLGLENIDLSNYTCLRKLVVSSMVRVVPRMNQPAKLESSTVQVPPRPQFDGTSSFDPQEQTASRSRTVDERADGSNVGGGVLRRVELTNVEFHDVHAELGRLQMCEVVKVQRCSSLTDASLLQNVRQLSLTHCDQLANVSKLGSGTVSDLDLSGCRRVADVSLLGTIRKLSLRHCTRVHDVSALGGVHELDLAGTSVVDVSALGEVHDLNLANTAVADVSKLGSVFRLNLGGTRIKDISALSGCSELMLNDCHCITDYSSLRTQYKLDLSGVPITDAVVKQLSKVKYVRLAGCTKVTDVTALRSAFSVDVSNCTSVTSVASLANVHMLNISGCIGIETARKKSSLAY